MSDKSPSDILREGADVYNQKNDDYSDSWRILGKVLHEMAGGEPVVIDGPEDWVRVGLYTRRMDKVVRAFNGELCGNTMNFESLYDSHADESVYAAMAASMIDDE